MTVTAPARREVGDPRQLAADLRRGHERRIRTKLVRVRAYATQLIDDLDEGRLCRATLQQMVVAAQQADRCAGDAEAVTMAIAAIGLSCARLTLLLVLAVHPAGGARRRR
jgi:hypothetical protein